MEESVYSTRQTLHPPQRSENCTLRCNLAIQRIKQIKKGQKIFSGGVFINLSTKGYGVLGLEVDERLRLAAINASILIQICV